MFLEFEVGNNRVFSCEMPSPNKGYNVAQSRGPETAKCPVENTTHMSADIVPFSEVSHGCNTVGPFLDLWTFLKLGRIGILHGYRNFVGRASIHYSSSHKPQPSATR